jgi:predicted DNA-binding antitoxin AbrB/MazE fold protein
MNKILEATYSKGTLILSEAIDPALEGKKLKIVVLEAQETAENLTSEQRVQRVKDFLAWAKQISFKLPPDYQFNRDELHER